MPVTNKLLNKYREPECSGITAERKYYALDSAFVKRSLRPAEWQASEWLKTTHVPRFGNERLKNEGAVLELVRKETNIPVPTVYACFEDDDAVYLIVEKITGVGMNELSDEQRAVVVRELDQHLDTLHRIRSRTLGGPSGIVIPPYRAMVASPRSEWKPYTSETEDFVLCHNDLSQQNVLVDPETLKIRAIIDWEYAGFFPESYDYRFFERLGPSVIREEGKDDTAQILRFLNSHCV